MHPKTPWKTAITGRFSICIGAAIFAAFYKYLQEFMVLCMTDVYLLATGYILGVYG